MKENLDRLIHDATLDRDVHRLNVLRFIKTTFTNFIKEGKDLTHADEEKLLLKMSAQREDSIRQYREGKRQDLVDKETTELNILREYMPKQPSEDDIVKMTEKVIANFEIENNRKPEMRDMKSILSLVQMTYPSASGKIVSDVVKKNIQK